MPTRYGNLYEQCFTMDALFSAHRTARRGKRKTLSVLRFEQNLGANLAEIHRELTAGEYRPSPHRQFWVYEPKPRLIQAPAFRDVVVQHAIYAVVNPIFDRGFLPDSFGCRIGMGTHKASDQAQRYLRQSPVDSVTLQMDIRRFYYRIDRKILRRLIEKKIKDRHLVGLMMDFAEHSEPLGVPIGSLLSQLYALIYLNPLDHYIKRELKAASYVRYVDDFIIFGIDRAEAKRLRQLIGFWLADNLHLEFSRWTIAATKRGVNFVGYRTWRRTKFVRKRSLSRFRRSLRRGEIPSLISMLGHAKPTATHRHYLNQMEHHGYGDHIPVSQRAHSGPERHHCRPPQHGCKRDCRAGYD